jgi:hypothetical protein
MNARSSGGGPAIGVSKIGPGPGAGRRFPVPELLDQPVARDRPFGMEKKQGEKGALTSASEPQGLSVPDGLDRAE